jgi:superfamily I DNA/RNA helicase
MPFPTAEQKKVIEHTGKPLVVIAAPGTGKTSTIVARMIKLLKENPNREVSFVTFTRSSRRDTENKVRKEVGKEAFEEASFEFPRVSTLHTYAKSIIHKYAQLIGRNNNFSILIAEKNEHLILIAELIKDLELNVEPDRLFSDIVYFRCMQHFPSDSPIPAEKREEVLRHYDRLLVFYNTFDMECIVQDACHILQAGKADFPQVYLQVDEYQDLNPLDQRLVELASSAGGSQVVVVGDDAQSIYQFRHANPEGIKKLWNDGNWEKLRFKECHRLPIHILRAAQALISGENYLGAEVHIPPDNGNKIRTLECTTSDIQIEAVANFIKELIAKKKNKRNESISFKDIMILCPTTAFVKKVSSILESKFTIPTKQRKKQDIPDNLWRLLLVLRLLHSCDSLALHQWFIIAGLTPKKITELRRMALEQKKNLYEYCLEQKNEGKIKEIFNNLENLQRKITDAEQFRRALIDFPGLKITEQLLTDVNIVIDETTQRLYSVRHIIKSIHTKFGLIDSENEIAADISDENRVLVTTMYSAKGLEAEFIFIMWLNEGLMPMPKSNIQEQLRVLYVGMTRAKQDTIFTFHEKHDGSRRFTIEAMSPFLKKIISFLEVTRITKANCNSLNVYL